MLTYVHIHTLHICTTAKRSKEIGAPASLYLREMQHGYRLSGGWAATEFKSSVDVKFFFFFYSSRFVDSPMNCVGAIGDANNTVHAYAVWLLTNPAKI